ncbi:hypothetical protein RvVAT039_26240 [Agrobacterium vitis]|nr:hypothetical protein RvVAT039_26240 [Agrobacterium vitis]
MTGADDPLGPDNICDIGTASGTGVVVAGTVQAISPAAILPMIDLDAINCHSAAFGYRGVSVTEERLNGK